MPTPTTTPTLTPTTIFTTNPTTNPTTNRNNNFDELTSLIERANRARRLLSNQHRRCGNCSHTGHDRRSCPFNQEEAVLLKQYHQHDRMIQNELTITRLQPIINAIRSKPSSPTYCHSISLKMVENFKEGYYLTDSDTDPTEEISCCVCLENTKLNSIVAFQCGHGCCSECATICLKNISKKCPMCRNNIEEIRISRDIPLETFNTFQTFIKL